MSVTPIRAPEPSPLGRAMTAETVVRELMGGARNPEWVRKKAPRSCRVGVRTRPVLFWEKPLREWFERQSA